MTIGQLLDELHKLKQEMAELEKQKKAIKLKADEIEKQAIEAMEAQNTTQGAGASASGRIGEKAVAHIVDWDQFYSYIHDNKFYHLLQRRPSNPSCMEILEQGEKIPGLEKFTSKQINLRSI